MHTLVEQYLTAFGTKNIEKLSELYHDDVVLWEWGVNVFMGKEQVLNANKNLFDMAQDRLSIVVQGAASIDEYKHMIEMMIMIDNQMFSVVDVISIQDEKIISIQAYRGF